MSNLKVDKTNMKCPTTGNYITQGLFLEHAYKTERAVFTLKDEDYEYEGVIYLSLKRLFLEMEDLGEYEFATTVLLSWNHWQRISSNKLFSKMIDGWRDELEVKMRGRAIATIAKESQSESRSAMQAAKWLADRGWKTRGPGRPSKAEVEHETSKQQAIADEYKADVVRLK